MTRVSWCLTTSIDGEIKTIFPGAIDATDLAQIEPIIIRAVARRLKVEAAARAGQEPSVKTTAPVVDRKPAPPAAEATMTQSEIARIQGYTGDCCDTCGQFTMKRNGACLSCDSCGTTTGCS